MDPLPNINYIHVQAKTNNIIIVIYLINVFNEIWDYTNLFLEKNVDTVCITRINVT